MARLSLMALPLLVSVMVYAQKPCCGPEQFIAARGATVGLVGEKSPQGFYTYAYGAFDFLHQRFGYNLTISYPGGNSTHFRVIQEYGQDKQWIIDDEKRTCHEQPATRPQPNICIPANATRPTSMTFGGVLAESWLYEIRYPDVPHVTYVTVSVTQGTCNPIGGSMIGEVNGPAQTSIPIVETYSVMNMSVGIPDPDMWFTLPSYCSQQEYLRRPRSVQDLQAYHLPSFV